MYTVYLALVSLSLPKRKRKRERVVLHSHRPPIASSSLFRREIENELRSIERGGKNYKTNSYGLCAVRNALLYIKRKRIWRCIYSAPTSSSSPSYWGSCLFNCVWIDRLLNSSAASSSSVSLSLLSSRNWVGMCVYIFYIYTMCMCILLYILHTSLSHRVKQKRLTRQEQRARERERERLIVSTT